MTGRTADVVFFVTVVIFLLPPFSVVRVSSKGIRAGLRSIWLSLLIALAVATMGGCSNNSHQDSVSRPVRIGAIYPFSGPDAATGEELKAGIELGVEIANNNHAIQPSPLPAMSRSSEAERPIEVLYCDSKGDSATAAKCVEDLVLRQGAIALMGCYRSSATALASEQAEILKTPFLNAESTSPLLVQRGLRWFFRSTPDDEMFSRNFFDFLDAMRERHPGSGEKRIALVYENGLWGTSVAQAQQKLAWERGWQIVANVPYDAGAQNFDGEVESVRAAMPAVILQASYDHDALAIVRGYLSSGVRPPGIIGMNAGFIGSEFITSLGTGAENILSREVWALDLAARKPAISTINDLYRARRGRDMSGSSARSFTGIMVLAAAARSARKAAPEAMRQAIRAIDVDGSNLIMPWDGIRFDPETGQNTLGRGVIVQVQHGKYTTVWPESLADHEAIWPINIYTEGRPQ